MIADKVINTHEKVRNIQNRLYLTAKADRKRKFYAMYDKIYRKDILEEASIIICLMAGYIAIIIFQNAA